MLTTSNKETSENAGQPNNKKEIKEFLLEADKALLEGKPIVAHSAIRLAITELNET